jgi:hypothetical protein
MATCGVLAESGKTSSRKRKPQYELFRNIEEKVALHFEDNRGSPGIDILVVSELNAPAATS